MVKKTPEEKSNLLTINDMCILSGISRSGYYRYIKEPEKKFEKEARDKESFKLILKAYEHRGYAKGARGIHMRLLHMGI